MSTAPWTWAITESDGSVADRFPTERAARTALRDGGYPAGCAVERVPEPDFAS